MQQQIPIKLNGQVFMIQAPELLCTSGYTKDCSKCDRRDTPLCCMVAGSRCGKCENPLPVTKKFNLKDLRPVKTEFLKLFPEGTRSISGIKPSLF